jgi:ABC-type transport system involved in multi-copper enzyme maturation permease subunit
MAAKLAVTALVAAVFALLAQAAWLGAAMLLSSTRGTTGPLPPDFWSRTLGMQGRLVLLGVFVCLLGFGIANLTRNTGAALGVGFVYFAIVENAVSALRPGWVQWLFTQNLAALVSPDGHKISRYSETISPQGQITSVEQVTVLSNGRGALMLLLYTGIVVAAGIALFRRRDLT